MKRYLDDIVIIAVIVVGLGGGVAFSFFPDMTTIIAIFFSLAITAFTYRFLGGIDENTTLTIGTLKVTGTIAVLLGAFMLFDNRLDDQSIQGVELRPKVQTGNAFLFNGEGEPVAFTVLSMESNGDTSAVTLTKLPRERFRNISRDLYLEENKLYVRTKMDSIDLGFIDKSRQEISKLFLTPEQLLHLGLYYSSKDTTGSRIDPLQAIEYLTQVLESEDPKVANYKLPALNQLYFLQPHITREEVFQLLIKYTLELRSGYYRDLELADTYLRYSKKAKDEIKNKKMALIYYLHFLSSRQSQSDIMKTRKKTVQDLVKDLIEVYLPEDEYIGVHREEILRSVKDHDRKKLLEFSNTLLSGMNGNTPES